MAETPSKMIPLRTAAPDFTLPNAVDGRTLSLRDIRGEKATLIMFICNHCPFVKRIARALAQLGRDYENRPIGIAAINANDAVNYPEDAPDKMRDAAEKIGYTFPYLFDETQTTARAYGAVCTPDFFLFDGELKCAYRGQLDGARPGNDIPATGEDLRRAIDLLLDGKTVPEQGQRPSIGCSIKWK